MSDMIRVKQSDGSYRITTKKAEDKKKSLGISNSGSSNKSGSTYYSYKDKDTGKSMSTSSKAVADARSGGSYTDNSGGSYKSGSVPTDYGDSVKRAINSAMILGNTLAPDFTDGTRLAYKDQYGYTHTTANPDVARLAGVGDIYKYFGPVTNSGYVANDKGESMMNVDPASLGGSKYIPSLIPNIGGISGLTPTATAGARAYNEGGINYENIGGQIYKNGTLVPESNYGYIPQQVGGTRQDTPLIPQVPQVGASLIPSMPTNVVDMPIYDMPAPPKYDVYQPREFDPNRDWEAPDVPSMGISWVPTNRAHDAFNQSEQNRYNASLNNYNAQRQDWSDLQNIQWQQLQEQQRRTESQQATQTAEKEQKLATLLSVIQLTGTVTPETSAAFKELTGVDLPPGMTADQAYRQAELALSQAKASSGGSSGGGGSSSTPKLTQTERQNQATAEAMQAVDKALKGGASPEQVRASIVAQTPQLIADGVDPTEIDSYLTTVSTTMQKTQQDTEKQRLQQRPFWQKGIDAILPWGQFR